MKRKNATKCFEQRQECYENTESKLNKTNKPKTNWAKKFLAEFCIDEHGESHICTNVLWEWKLFFITPVRCMSFAVWTLVGWNPISKAYAYIRQKHEIELKEHETNKTKRFICVCVFARFHVFRIDLIVTTDLWIDMKKNCTRIIHAKCIRQLTKYTPLKIAIT